MASSNAADAQRDAASQASGTQLSMYNQTRSDQTPWRTSGTQALNALDQFYGLQGLGGPAGGGGAPSGMGAAYGYGGLGADGRGGQFGAGPLVRSGQPLPGGTQQGQQPIDYNKLLSNMPGYQFQLQQGQRAVNSNLAARGLLNSGAAGKALTQYGQGLAGSYADKYVNGLQSLAGLGQTSVGQTGAAGANAANQIGSNQIYAGNASASGYANTANAINQGLGGLVGAYGYYNSPQYSSSDLGSDYQDIP